jgi:WD40 repeat protein
MQWVRPGPRGKHILIGEGDGEVWLVPVDGTAPRLLGDMGGNTRDGALGLHAAAALSGNQNHEIRVWDLETGEEQTLDTGDVLRDLRRQMLRFTPDGHLISGGRDRIRIWNLADGSFETLSERPGLLDLSADGRLLGAGHVFPGNEEGEQGPAVLYDLEAGTTIQLDSHGPSSFARLDAGGKIVLTQSEPDGLLRVGPVTGEAPHLLVGQAPMYISDISPDGRWVAGVSIDEPTTIRLWPVPDLSQPPLHTLPYEELLAKLRTLTNLRVVKDPESETGWNWALDPFPGWEEMPTW